MFSIGAIKVDTILSGAFTNKMKEAQLDMHYTAISMMVSGMMRT